MRTKITIEEYLAGYRSNFYSKELLRKASPSFVLRGFGGKSRIRKYNWFIRFIRWALMMEPEYDFVLPPLPKGNKIKFRRYESLEKFPEYTETEISTDDLGRQL